jgi:hypothetical protein
MAYPLSMSDDTTPMPYCSLLIPKARTFAKVGIADNKILGFGIPVSGAHMKARDGYDNDGTQDSGHGGKRRCVMELAGRHVAGGHVEG